MKRLLLVLMTIAAALSAAARDDHIRPYLDGVAAADAGQWATVVEKMQQAITHEPEEKKSIRIRGGSIEYVPHFWTGIALANQERWDFALQEFAVSEKQGVIQNTKFFSTLRATKSRIEARKASASSSLGVDDARKLADAALTEAVDAQAAATSAGAARLSEFRQAAQKLQEAIANRKDGTVAGYRAMEESASEATNLFNKAASKAKAQETVARVQPRQSTPVAPIVRPVPANIEPVRPEQPAPQELVSDRPSAAGIHPASVPAAEEPRVGNGATTTAIPSPVRESEPVRASTPSADAPSPAEGLRQSPAIQSPASSADDQLDAAYRTMVAGDLDGSSFLLTRLLDEEPRALDALILRGYVRYLQGVLERRETLVDAAAEDFLSALAIDPDVRLDEDSFSPKAVRFFDALVSR